MNNTATLDEILDIYSKVLLRCALLGIAVLFIWWGALELLGELAYSVHSGIAPMSRGQFEIIHYVGMLFTKAAVSVLFIFPYIAVKLVTGTRRKKLNQTA